MTDVVDPTTNPDGEVQLDENGNPIGPPTNISPEVMEDMKNIWMVFDLKDEKRIKISELRTILKALDIKIEDEDVLDLIQQRVDPDETGYLTWDNLKAEMEEQLKEKDTMEDLLEQFKKLDKDNDGKIPVPELKQFLANMGTKMQPDDIEDFIKFADPKGEGSVDIAELAESLCPKDPSK